MNLIKVGLVVSTLFSIATMTGCERLAETPEMPEMPALNEENCKPENISKLDKATREKFSSQCLRRGSFKPSTPKSW